VGKFEIKKNIQIFTLISLNRKSIARLNVCVEFKLTAINSSNKKFIYYDALL